jgi:hypothetical protein
MKEIAVMALATPGIYGIRNRSLFALANRSQFYTLESDEVLAGGRQAHGIPSLS